MSRPKSRKPGYCLHKPSGRAFVVLDGKFVYLGRHGTPESRDEYDRVIGEWIVAGRRSPPPATAGTAADPTAAGMTVSELIAAFWTHATTYYARTDGTSTGELENFRLALRPLRRLYGPTAAAAFGPLQLKAVRGEMLKGSTRTDPHTGQTKELPGWSRTYANRQVARLRQAFKWAVGEGLIPPSVHHGLMAVDGLRRGRSDARETEPVRPVAEATVAATLAHLSSTVRAMVELQLLTGMRPGELCALRTCDLDRTGPIWAYRPPAHKTEHHGHERIVYLGPQAQAVLGPFLRPNLAEEVFVPSEAAAERRAARTAARKTPVSCGNRPGTNRVSAPARRPGDKYDVAAYRRAIARACEKAFGMPRGMTPAERKAWRAAFCWHPHQLRHTAATNLRKQHGLEAAQVILGHRTLTVTQVYAERNVAAAQAVMAAVG